MNILDFPVPETLYEKLEHLGDELINDAFETWREDYQAQFRSIVDEKQYIEMTLDLWEEVAGVVEETIDEEFQNNHKVEEKYVLAIIKQRVQSFQGKVFETLHQHSGVHQKKSPKKSEGKSNVIQLFR